MKQDNSSKKGQFPTDAICQLQIHYLKFPTSPLNRKIFLMEFSGTEENKIITAPGGIQTKVILIDLTQPFGPLPLQSQKTV